MIESNSNQIRDLHRHFKSILLIISLIIVILFYYYMRFDFHKRLLLFEEQKPHEISINCSKFGFNHSLNETTPVYDFFIFGYELDMLEIRLYELYDHVTLFLIAESARTLSGKPKPLYLKENWARYTKYHDKIRRVEVELDVLRQPSDSWENERKMRDVGLRLALPQLSKYCCKVLT